MALFGSVIRDDFTPESDVDILVEFQPGRTPGFAYFDMERDLSGIIGRKVDLNTPSELSKYFRQEVLDEAEEIICRGVIPGCISTICLITLLRRRR